MTRSIDAPPVKVGTAEVVLEAVVVEVGAVEVEVEVTVDVTIVEEDVEVAVGVVKVEMIPLPLTGYYQQSYQRGSTCKATLVQDGMAGVAVPEKQNIW